MNEKPFEFRGFYGCVFQAERSDFKGGIRITVPSHWRAVPDSSPDTLLWMAQDAIEMIAMHQKEIAPHLTDFAGYRFTGGSIPVGIEYAM